MSNPIMPCDIMREGKKRYGRISDNFGFDYLIIGKKINTLDMENIRLTFINTLKISLLKSF